MSISGKVAVITGSNSGIGLGVAEELAKRGAKVVLNSFSDSEDDHALAAKIAAESGSEVVYIKADMSKADECRALITQTVERFGACDILVNNAGFGGHGGFLDRDLSKDQAMIDLNISALVTLSHLFGNDMRVRGGGKMLQVSSTASFLRTGSHSVVVGIVRILHALGVVTK